jgi:hypothetical protein
MNRAEMIAKAWMDETYRASLLAQGIDVPPRPEDLADHRIDDLARTDGEEHRSSISASCFC